MGVVRVMSEYRPPQEVMEHRVAQLEDGYIMLAMELYEALIGANLTRNQAKVAHAVCRKTYGFKKKMDRIADSQIAELCNISRPKANIAKNELIAMRVLLRDGSKVGPNKDISQWVIPECSQLDNIVTKSGTKNVTKLVTPTVPKTEHTKDIFKDKRNKTPLNPPEGVEALALKCLDYYNHLSGGRCSSTASFEKALATVKAKGICYTVDEVNLVVKWALTCWDSRKTAPKPNNICRMTRFDGYLSDALVWADGGTQNPMPCPHEDLIAMWNEKFPAKAIATHEWNRRRPAYGNLEAVWNGKTNSGNWREAKHIGTAFDLIRQSSLFASSETKPWLTLDWILTPKNWGQVYEQAINEHRQRKGATA